MGRTSRAPNPYLEDDDRTPLRSTNTSDRRQDATWVSQLTTSRRMMRRVLLFFAIFFMIIGVSVIGIGAWASQATVMRVFSHSATIAVIVLGFFLLVVSAIGFWTAKSGNRFLILVNGVLLAAICGVFVLLSIAIFVIGGKVHSDLYLNEIGKSYSSAALNDPKDVCEMERILTCSGFSNDTTDGFSGTNAQCWKLWTNSTSPNFKQLCPTYDKSNPACFCPTNCSIDNPASGPKYDQTCYARVRSELSSHFTAVAASTLTFDIFLFLGCLFNWCLCCRARRKLQVYGGYTNSASRLDYSWAV